jgi:hypothetical protein
LSSSLVAETQFWEVWEYKSFFDSALEDLLSADASTLSSSISPDALQPGYDEPASFEPAPENQGVASLDLSLENGALQPGLDLAVDVNSASDYYFGFSNLSSLPFSGELNTAMSLKRNDFGSLLPEPSFSPDYQHLSPAATTSQNPPLPILRGSSRLPVPPLPLFKCPQCPQGFFDRCQLK